MKLAHINPSESAKWWRCRVTSSSHACTHEDAAAESDLLLVRFPLGEGKLDFGLDAVV